MLEDVDFFQEDTDLLGRCVLFLVIGRSGFGGRCGFLSGRHELLEDLDYPGRLQDLDLVEDMNFLEDLDCSRR